MWGEKKIAMLWNNIKWERTSKLQQTQINACIYNAIICRMNK
jgi:hypothetical protein